MISALIVLLKFVLYCRGTWRDETFKDYNFNAMGLLPAGGHLHPLLKVCWRCQGRRLLMPLQNPLWQMTRICGF